jgi:lipopolysaccharide export system permease protein
VISTLDRMFLISFTRSYLVVWTSLVSLYVVIDLFTNIDDFGRKGGGLGSVAEHIATYYGYRVIQIFDLMAEFITLMAAMFTVAWLQRNNELLPQLSAGIPTRRVLRPILLGAAVTLALGPINQELVIPMVADELMKPRDDPDGAKAAIVMGAFDPATSVHIEGMAGLRNERKILKFYVTIPETAPTGMAHLLAEEAVYHPPGSGPCGGGGWLMTSVKPDDFSPGTLPPYLVPVAPGDYFLKTDVDFDGASRGGTWFLFASTARLRELLERPEPRRQAKIAVEFHRRVTRPLIGSILVMLGLSVILRNPNRHVFISVGLCLAICVVFYASVLGCKALGTNDIVSPPLAAWLPVLVFGPLTVVWFDAIHT